MKRKINVIFIIIFVLSISLPYLFAHRNKEGRSSGMENRTLAKYPSLWTEDEGFNKDYPEQFENWLNDNLRGRAVLVMANSTLQYRLFERIVKSDTMQGDEQWFFVNDEEMIREYQRLNLMTEEELERYAENMQGISDYLKDRDIAFYYFQTYSKEEIYPEHYVKGINQIGPISKADQIVNVLQEKTDVRQILNKETLLAHKDEMIYYQFADILHWNEKGSFYGYQDLMTTLHEDFEQIPILQESDFNYVEAEETIQLYGFEYPHVEICPSYAVKNSQAVEITEMTQERWNFLHYKEHTHEYINESCENNMKILILGDSFVRMYLKDDIAESFYGTLSIDWLNIPILDEVVEEYQPDIVIIESAQKALADTINLVNQVDFIKEQE